MPIATMATPILCSDCFSDQGLRLNALQVGIESSSECANCGLATGRKLTKELVAHLAERFFVRGTINRFEFGAAPAIQFNDLRQTSITTFPWTEPDVRLFEKTLGVGFFLYGPRLWMVGEVEPLKGLQRPLDRARILERIIKEYPTIELNRTDAFYRLRLRPKDPTSAGEYDSPPVAGNGRLDSTALPVLYASQDLQICVHECRVAVDDESYVATLAPARSLRLLDLTALLKEDVSEFESLDLAVHMVFLAEKRAYELSRLIALEAFRAKYDGLIYPSYFSLIRTGGMPFDTIYGISIRRIPQLAERAGAQMIPNIAVFGRPIHDHKVSVRCINRLIVGAAQYSLVLGPVGFH
jgi:hypothetical protein